MKRGIEVEEIEELGFDLVMSMTDEGTDETYDIPLDEDKVGMLVYHSSEDKVYLSLRGSDKLDFGKYRAVTNGIVKNVGELDELVNDNF